MANAKIICPMLGTECVEGGAIRNGELVACRFWICVQGKHPQTGETVNNHDCAMAWLPVLLIENSKMSRETGAAVESLRNEHAKVGNGMIGALLTAAQMRQELPAAPLPAIDLSKEG